MTARPGRAHSRSAAARPVVSPTYRGGPWTLSPDAPDHDVQAAARSMHPDGHHDVVAWLAERRPISYFRFGDLEEMQVVRVPRKWADQGRAPSGYYLMHAEPDGYARRLYGPFATEAGARYAASVELADDDEPEVLSGKSPRQHVLEGFRRTEIQ